MLRRCYRRAAYNLAEVLIATALVGVVMVAALNTLGGATETWLSATRSQDAESLAHELMAEILAQAYSDPETTDDPDREEFGVEAGESGSDRATFDDLDDYDDWSASPPESRDGAALTTYTDWTREAIVQKLKSRKVDDFHKDDDKDREARLITVAVTDPKGEVVVLKAIRSQHGGLERSIGVDTTVVENLEMTLSAGGGEIRAATRLPNHAEAP